MSLRNNNVRRCKQETNVALIHETCCYRALQLQRVTASEYNDVARNSIYAQIGCALPVCGPISRDMWRGHEQASDASTALRAGKVLLLLRNTEQTSIWMAWLRHAQGKKGDNCEKK